MLVTWGGVVHGGRLLGDGQLQVMQRSLCWYTVDRHVVVHGVCIAVFDGAGVVTAAVVSAHDAATCMARNSPVIS